MKREREKTMERFSIYDTHIVFIGLREEEVPPKVLAFETLFGYRPDIAVKGFAQTLEGSLIDLTDRYHRVIVASGDHLLIEAHHKLQGTENVRPSEGGWHYVKFYIR